jgi:hypothetical protein
MLPRHAMTNLGWTTFFKQFPVSNGADNSSLSSRERPGTAVWGFARRDMYCVALILVISLNCFILHEFDLSSFLFLLGIVHAVAESRQKLTGIRRIAYIGLIKRLMLAEVN